MTEEMEIITAVAALGRLLDDLRCDRVREPLTRALHQYSDLYADATSSGWTGQDYHDYLLYMEDRHPRHAINALGEHGVTVRHQPAGRLVRSGEPREGDTE